MDQDETIEPWQELEKLVDDEQIEAAHELLEDLTPGETTRAVLRLDDAHQTHLFSSLPPEDAAELIEDIPDTEAAELFESLPAETAAAIVHELPSSEQADLVGDLPTSEADAILAEMVPDEAEQLRKLIKYDDDVAGGLMVTEFLAFPETLSVDQVISDLRTNADQYARYDVQYVFVTTTDHALVGVLRLRDLLLASRSQTIGELMVRDLLTLPDSSTLDELRDFFDTHRFFGVPITDEAGSLVGVVRRTAVEEALGERAESDFRRTQGIVREELRSMPLLVRSRRRLGWLSINIGLNIMAASVIVAYQDTLAQVIALAVFLPIISDMSGCTGSQASAVSMRELALGVVKPFEFSYVLLKELGVGLINGLALGLLIGSVAYFWNGNPYLGLVVGAAMAGNTLVAVSLGGVIPLVLRRAGVDPALASGPILTTITDMCGFFLVLGIASALLPLLV